MEEYKFVGARLMPVLPIRGISVFPGTMLTFDVERPGSKAALNAAMEGDQIIFLTAQKDPGVNNPTDQDVYHMGTISRIKQILKNPNGKTVRVLVDGLVRGEMDAMYMKDECAYAYVSAVEEEVETDPALAEALLRRCVRLFGDYAERSGNVPHESMLFAMTNSNPGLVADVIAQSIYLKPEQKQMLLSETLPSKRLELLRGMLEHEIKIAEIDRQINDATNEQVSQAQRDYYLREQMKVIASELGEDDDDDASVYRTKIRALNLEKEGKISF